MNAAALAGQLQTLQWIRDHLNSSGCASSTFSAAIRENQLETLRRLHEHYLHGLWDRLSGAEYAIENDFREVARLLYGHHRQYELISLSIPCAAHHGDLEMVQWLCSKLAERAKPTDWVAHGGHLHAVKWLHEFVPDGGSSIGTAMDNATF